jgi:predicted DNA-binding transcriptional regulator AlpA
MDEDLLSKKELLELTGISYGQLYRWKRKNLIPEQWFIRKSTFTGQETFFPKAQILSRIEKIKSMKNEDISLEDIADVFSPILTDISLSCEEIIERGIINAEVMEIYKHIKPVSNVLHFNDILFLFMFYKAISSGSISLDEGKTLISMLDNGFKAFEGSDCEVIIARKLGVFTCMLISKPCVTYFEQGLKIIFCASISGFIEELKLKLN